MGCFSGGGSSTTAMSTLGKYQKEVDKVLGPMLKTGLGQGATPYPGRLTTDIPQLLRDAYERFSGTVGQFTQPLTQALSQQVAGTPAWTSGYGETVKSWKENFASPLMETWRRNIAPVIEEQANAIPGGYYSAARGRDVSESAGRYFQEAVQPTLFGAHQADIQRGFESAEAAANRVLPASQMLSALPHAEFSLAASAAGTMDAAEQARLDRQYMEFMRNAAENNPYIQLALAYINQGQLSIQQEREGEATGPNIANTFSPFFSPINILPTKEQ